MLNALKRQIKCTCAIVCIHNPHDGRPVTASTAFRYDTELRAAKRTANAEIRIESNCSRSSPLAQPRTRHIPHHFVSFTPLAVTTLIRLTNE